MLLIHLPLQILHRIGSVPYQIALPPYHSNIHNIFYVSQLRKYIPHPSHVIEPDVVQLRENLSYEISPVRINDNRIKQCRDKQISSVKVIWNEATGHTTRELEDKMR